MASAVRAYLLSRSDWQRLRPANDSRGVWVGMLPFSRLPFYSALVGLSLLAPLVLLDSGFSLYSASRQQEEGTAPSRQLRISIDGQALDVPPALQRAVRVERGVATFHLERIGRHLMSANGKDAASPLHQTIRISSAKTRPSARTILHSLSALHAPVLVESGRYGLETYRLASGPITKAQELVVGLMDEDALKHGDVPFFAVCALSADSNARSCTAYMEAGNLFVEVAFDAQALDEWRLLQSSALAFAESLKEKGAIAAP